MPLVPEIPGSGVTPVPIRPHVVDPSTLPYDGGVYFAVTAFLASILLIMVIFWIIIKVWGSPIIDAKSARISGDAIVQHFENSRIGTLKLARIGGGALRHRKVEDGTLITIPKGINNLGGLPMVNSWNLTGISVPVFLAGAITLLKKRRVSSKDELESVLEKQPESRYSNIITDSYNFNNFKDVIDKSKEPNKISIEIEHVSDFIQNQNQHYLESDISKEVKSYTMGLNENFAGVFITTAIGLFIVALGIYFIMGSIK